MPKITVSEVLLALLEGKFKRASNGEQEGFAGCEGECWLWDSKYGVVVADLCITVIVIQVFEDDFCWSFDFRDGEFELLC